MAVSEGASFYGKLAPHPALAPYVEHIGVQQNDSFDAAMPRTRILPTGTMDLLFHFGDPFVRFDNHKASTEPAAYLTGQRTRMLEVAATGSTGIVLVSLYPWGLSGFTGFPAHHVADMTLDLEELFGGRTMTSLIDRLGSEGSPLDRASLVERFLLDRLQEQERDRLVEHAAARINANFGDTRIDELAASLGISKRQLDRRFLCRVGVSPKTFARVIRFQKSIYHLGVGTRLADAALACGYHDQSHMIRDYHQFAQNTPERLFHEREHSDLMRGFNTARLSHFYNTTYLH